MWYYDYIVPSFLVLLIFQFYYLARPRLPIRINRTFDLPADHHLKLSCDPV